MESPTNASSKGKWENLPAAGQYLQSALREGERLRGGTSIILQVVSHITVMQTSGYVVAARFTFAVRTPKGPNVAVSQRALHILAPCVAQLLPPRLSCRG